MPPSGEKLSKWIPGRYPPPGTSLIGDAIRQRRGSRGITVLDAALLHVPPAAEGWNTLFGALRTQGSLTDDIRELIVLRVSAINGAACGWIHHEPVGRKGGLTTAQLFVIRDITTPLPPAQGILKPLQTAALLFADASSRTVSIPAHITEGLRTELRNWVVKEISGLSEDGVKSKVDDLFVEASLVVASYNMVSRFLVGVDVAGFSEEPVPWPLDRKEHFIPIPAGSPTHTIHAITLKSADSAPWIVFVNSLLTDYTLWSFVLPFFISKAYNIILFSQRGHGQSTLPSSPPKPEHDPRIVTIPYLAEDIQHILDHLSILTTDVKSIIGVSQGGATALAYAATFSEIQSIVVCDTAARTPEGNNAAWMERIQLVGGDQLSGMKRLADATVPRWFPPGSKASPQNGEGNANYRANWIGNLIRETQVEGFEAGARALGVYDTVSSGIMESRVENVLLLAGSLDGGGKVGATLERFSEEWNGERERQGLKRVEYIEVGGSGHLPMVDEPEVFWRLVSEFLETF